LVVRVADQSDAGAIASLRSLWSADAGEDPGFEARLAAWLAVEGERRTPWLAVVAGMPAGMASLFEYRRMPRPSRPDARWGYVSNVFVREDFRNRGIGSTLLGTVIAAADKRSYVRLVLSPSARALPFFRRAGFIVADDDATGALLLIRTRVDRSHTAPQMH
jgi:GNAT superfamily N-acetyltransferase